MSKQCELCNKKPLKGNNVSHSNRRTKTRWMPNLQILKLDIGGITKKVKLCTGCLRTYIKKNSVKV